MEILIEKYNGKDKPSSSNLYRILDYKILVNSTNLLLVRDGKMEVDDSVTKLDSDFFEIFKVQFIASCSTELAEGLIIAFYIGEGGELLCYVLGGLPRNHYEKEDRFLLIDYKGYTEICELTGETKLPFFNYIVELKAGRIAGNTFLSYNGEFLNEDKQSELWKILDNNKAAKN